jgi:hypothetical protein
MIRYIFDMIGDSTATGISSAMYKRALLCPPGLLLSESCLSLNFLDICVAAVAIHQVRELHKTLKFHALTRPGSSQYSSYHVWSGIILKDSPITCSPVHQYSLTKVPAHKFIWEYWQQGGFNPKAVAAGAWRGKGREIRKKVRLKKGHVDIIVCHSRKAACGL